jgi:hypothetical protein
MKKAARVRITLIVLAVIGCVLGYGYWHASTRASFFVQVGLMDEATGRAQHIPGAEVVFLDSEGRVLANGISDENYNFVHLIHPEVGDCHEIEEAARFSAEAREAWQGCFEQLSVWIPQWIGEVRQVDVRNQECAWKGVPVTISEGSSDWHLWWVPHPHIGGKPLSNYSLSITLRAEDCDK